MKGYIYKLTSPKGKHYIGQTINMERRLSDYKTFHHCENQKKLYNAIKKYGFENFEHSILETLENESKLELQTKLNELEIFYIKKYDCIQNGYNICTGGNQHRLGVKETEEQKQKKRDMWTSEKRLIQSEKWKGLANPRKGKKFGRSSHAKYVNQYTLEGIFIKTWESLTSITKEIPTFNFKNISSACNNKIKQAYGFIWRFKENESTENIIVDLSRKEYTRTKEVKGTTIYQFNLLGVFIAEFKNMQEASRQSGVPQSNISKCCSKERKKAGGFIWKLSME